MNKILSFFICGVVQFGLDTALFTGLTWLGVSVALANIISRGSAACLGYYINGRFTFQRKMDKYVFLKFVVYWAGMTVLSTALIYLFEHYLITASSVKLMAMTKVFVEILLFFVSFLIAKIWVYKK
ncbi:GtrA family protein [Phytobacter sp. AG2a]